jgi:hypothetical protein
MIRSRPTSPAWQGLGRFGALASALAGVLTMAACRTGPAEAPATSDLDREAFIATYVDLRSAAVREDRSLMDEDRRRQILEEHGVTEAELLAFAEAHGEDVSFMKGVWDDVEAKLDSLRLSETGPDIPR